MPSEGNNTATETQKSLLKVVTSSQKIASNIQLITDAFDRQAEGIQQITIGIDQISSVIQANSATAEESAAASEELSSQANLLRSLVGPTSIRIKPDSRACYGLHASTGGTGTKKYTLGRTDAYNSTI